MTIWAIADLHLAFATPDKSMEFFGPIWKDYTTKLSANWKAAIAPDDLVLIAGDISWAIKQEQAKADLEWIDALPGTKVILRGNHDYWWPTTAQLKKLLPPSIHFIHNNHFDWNNTTIGGARLWDCPDFSFGEYIAFQANPKARSLDTPLPDGDKIYQRELQRLRVSLETLNPQAKHRIVMTHYPPVSANLDPSPASAIFEEFHIDHVVFGHLHSLKPDQRLFGEKKGIHYWLTACDYLQFHPLKII